MVSGDTALEARLLSVPKSDAQQVSLTKATVKKVKDTREETAQETADTSVAQKTACIPVGYSENLPLHMINHFELLLVMTLFS